MSHQNPYLAPGLNNFNRKIDPYNIKVAAAKIYDISVFQLDMKCRKQEFKDARFIAMYFCKLYTKWTLERIGMYFNYRNHATVLHSIKSVKNWMETDKQFRQNVYKIRNQIKILQMENLKAPKTVNQLLDIINNINVDDVNENLGVLRQKLINIKKSHKKGGLTIIDNTEKILQAIEMSKAKQYINKKISSHATIAV